MAVCVVCGILITADVLERCAERHNVNLGDRP